MNKHLPLRDFSCGMVHQSLLILKNIRRGWSQLYRMSHIACHNCWNIRATNANNNKIFAAKTAKPCLKLQRKNRKNVGVLMRPMRSTETNFAKSVQKGNPIDFFALRQPGQREVCFKVQEWRSQNACRAMRSLIGCQEADSGDGLHDSVLLE